MIELAALQEMFNEMRAGTDWNLDGPMLWGYFFTDGSEPRLRALLPLLEAQGYRLVDVVGAAVERGEAPCFILHVDRQEIHSAQSLHARNAQLQAFAALHELRSYDGMDVGPIDDPVTPR